MRMNKFIDLELGAKLKKFTLYFSVFAITFGVVSAILNTGGTYAADTSTSCPSGYKVSTNNSNYCCPNKYNYKYDSAVEKCYREINADANYSCDTSAGETIGHLADETDTAKCFVEAKSSKKYTITYYANGGYLVGTPVSGTIYEIDYFEGTSVQFPIPTKDGYTFKGWQNGAGNIIASITIKSDVSLTAIWEKNFTTYTVTLKPEGGTVTYNTIAYDKDFPAYVDEGEELLLPSNGNKSGHTLSHWSNSTGSVTYRPGERIKISANITLKAVWVPVATKFTATFNINGGIWANKADKNDIVVEYTSTYSLVNNSKIAVSGGPNGEQLCGWYSSKQKSVLTSELDSVNDGDMLTANWCNNGGGNTPDTPDEPDIPSTGPETPEPEVEVTVTLEPQNGSSAETRKCTIEAGKNDCKITLPTVKKQGHTFDGWSTGSKCTGDKKTGSISVSRDTTYYACYKDNTPVEPGDTPSDGELDIDEIPNTGNWLLYVAYLVGALALGYTGYYSYKMVKIKNND